MIIGNVQLMHGCCSEDLRMATAKMKLDIYAEEVKQKLVNTERSTASMNLINIKLKVSTAYR